MSVTVEAYYDFRSPYAYFADQRLRDGSFGRALEIEWRWRPVSIDVLLNLQAGREPWAAYVDPLPPPKRAHLMADVRRMSQFYGAPLRPPNPARPNPIPAMFTAARLEGACAEAFRHAVFDALWREQRDIAEVAVLTDCLTRAGGDEAVLQEAFSEAARAEVAERTLHAYAAGVFGVPTFVYAKEVFFGVDRLEVLAWKIGRAAGVA